MVVRIDFRSRISVRLVYLMFFNSVQLYRSTLYLVHESGYKIICSLVVLFSLSVVGGFFLQDLFLGLGSASLWVFSVPTGYFTFEVEVLVPPIIKLMAFTLFLVGGLVVVLTWVFYRHFYQNSMCRLIFFILNKKWLWDKLQVYLVYFTFCVGLRVVYFFLDKGLFERVGFELGCGIFARAGWKLFLIQYGQVDFYLYLITFFGLAAVSFLLCSAGFGVFGLICLVLCFGLVKFVR